MSLKTECLRRVPLTELQIEDVFATRADLDHETLLGVVRQLCLSHERLRAELSGAEILLQEGPKQMELDEARRIVSACLDTKYHLMSMSGYEGEYRPLPKVSLEEMLLANRLVSDAGSTPDPIRGGKTLHMTIDPRGVAAMYAREMYQHQPHDVLEAMGWTLSDNQGDYDDE